MEYTGIITRIRFYSEETKYIVASFDSEQEEKPFTITGYMSYVNLDDKYRITGDYIVHPKYGKQFKVETYAIILADDREEIIRYLSSPLFKGIGEKQATLIVDVLGQDALNKIREDDTCLDFIKGMTAKKKETIVSVLTHQAYDQEVLSFFMGHGISTRYIETIRSVYQERTLDVLTQNPYQLIDDIDGIGFKSADALAMKIGIAPDDPHRMAAALLYSVKDTCFQSGSTYTELLPIEHRFGRLIGMEAEDVFDDTLQQLIDDGRVIREKGRYYPEDLYHSEKLIAAKIKGLLKSDVDVPDADFSALIDEIEERYAITYDDVQRDALMTFVQEPVMILTGGPGTGKTTIVQAILELYSRYFPDDRIDLAAPTGRAAKRLSELTEREASTIHRLLKWDLTSNTFAMNSANPLDTDFLVIDEFSMVDTLLMSRLLEATHLKKLLLIGDDEQLPSVSPGEVLKDFIDSETITTIRLNKIYRQEEGSGIVALAHDIRNDRYQPEIFSQYDDIHFINSDSYHIVPIVCQIVSKAIAEGYDEKDVQVLAPMYQGVAGIDALNEALQQLFNPAAAHKQEVSQGQRVFREGDKILQLKNRPDDNVFNGDIGTLVEIIPKDGREYLEDTVIIAFDDAFVTYGSSDLQQITHAYAMSIHKSQGNEFKIVIMAIVQDFPRMIRRNLLYTGITRAKQALFVLGSQGVVSHGMARKVDATRRSSLKERLMVKKTMKLEDFEDSYGIGEST